MLFLHSLNSLNILLLFNIKAFPLREFLFLFVVVGSHNRFSKSKCKSHYLVDVLLLFCHQLGKKLKQGWPSLLTELKRCKEFYE